MISIIFQNEHNWKGKHTSGQIIIFDQPRFPWNKGISLTITTIWGEGPLWGRYNLTRHTTVFSHLGAPPSKMNPANTTNEITESPLPNGDPESTGPSLVGEAHLGISCFMGVLFISGAWCFVCAWMNMGVSTNNGIPIWMVYNGNPY